MIGVPLIALAAAWIQHIFTQFRIWIIVRTIEAITKDIEASMSKLRARKKEITELKKQMNTELSAWENRLRTIIRDPPTSEQAKVTQDEKERLRTRVLVIQQRFTALLNDFESISVALERQADRLQALEEELHQYRLIDTTVYPRLLLFTDNHA